MDYNFAYRLTLKVLYHLILKIWFTSALILKIKILAELWRYFIPIWNYPILLHKWPKNKFFWMALYSRITTFVISLSLFHDAIFGWPFSKRSEDDLPVKERKIFTVWVSIIQFLTSLPPPKMSNQMLPKTQPLFWQGHF